MERIPGKWFRAVFVNFLRALGDRLEKLSGETTLELTTDTMNIHESRE